MPGPVPVPGGPGVLPVLLPVLPAGDTALWGGEVAPQGCPEGLRLPPGRSAGVLSPPVDPLGAKEGDGAAAQPWRPTDPAAPHKPSQKVPRGRRGAERGDGCDTPGCRTRPPSPPAAPGNAGGPWAALGTLTPPGHPAQSHPINRVQGSPLSMATPGGLGRAPGAN